MYFMPLFTNISLTANRRRYRKCVVFFWLRQISNFHVVVIMSWCCLIMHNMKIEEFLFVMTNSSLVCFTIVCLTFSIDLHLYTMQHVCSFWLHVCRFEFLLWLAVKMLDRQHGGWWKSWCLMVWHTNIISEERARNAVSLLCIWKLSFVVCSLHYVSGSRCRFHIAQLMPLLLTTSCSSKSKLLLPFWCRLTQVVPDIIQEGRMSMCVHA